MPRETTEIVIDEHGAETHPSWIKLTASKLSGQTRLFDSEITHQHWIRVGVHYCARKRDLNRDHLFTSKLIAEFDMSEAQWGAFVSSFGSGSGVPATLTWLHGPVLGAPFESRLDESHREVKEAGDRALAEVQEAFDDLDAAFEQGAGKKVMRERIHTLRARLRNAPLNMEFAAQSLTEHVENVVTKARADIEGMALAAVAEGRMLEDVTPGLLGPAENSDS